MVVSSVFTHGQNALFVRLRIGQANRAQTFVHVCEKNVLHMRFHRSVVFYVHDDVDKQPHGSYRVSHIGHRIRWTSVGIVRSESFRHRSPSNFVFFVLYNLTWLFIIYCSWKYANVLMSISNTFASLPGIISPILTGHLIQDKVRRIFSSLKPLAR